ncbi:cyclic nucleotide-binding domain-containing protein [Hoeflea sp. CAU 1731]
MKSTLNSEVEMLRTIPLFAGVDPAKLKLLAFSSERVTFSDGQIIFKQGKEGDNAYVVLDGNADVIFEKDGEEILVAEVGKNALIGELAILCNAPRSATVRAKGRLEALNIKKEYFLGLITEFPNIGIHVMQLLAKDITNATRELANARMELAKHTSEHH